MAKRNFNETIDLTGNDEDVVQSIELDEEEPPAKRVNLALGLDQNRQASLASPSNAPSLVYEKNQNPGRTPLSLFEPSHSFPKEPKNSVAASTNRSSSKGGLVYSQSPQLASAPPRASPSPYSALSPSFQLFTPNHSFDKRPSEPNGSNQTTPQPLASKAPLASKPPAASKQSYWPPAASSSNFHNSTQAPPKQQRLKNKQAVTHSTSQQNNQRPLAPALPSNAPPLPYQGPNLLAGQFFPLSGKITKTPSKKRVYNTDTLARDILAAYGMHPKGSRLNAHLEKLNGRFGFDLHTTDVSTLRWDILDPGGPDMNIYKSPGRSQQGPTAGTDRGPTVPLTSANSAPKVISSQSVFSPGPILQKSSSLRQEFHPETSSMLPQQSAQISLAGIPGVELQIGPSKSALPSISQSAFERANTPNVNTRSLQKQTSGAPGSPLSVQVIIPSSSQSLQLLTAGTEGRDTPKRGRGRPPKTYTPSDHKTLTPRLRERPPKEQNGDTSIKRKRGRPFKNKPEPDSTDSELTPVPEAFYISFICEWEDCPAELHNLDTLTAHVFKVHGVKTGSGHFVCKWKNCRLSTATEDEHGRSDHERADNHLSVSLGDELREFLSKKPASKDSQSEIDEQFANEQDAQDHEAERDATERFFEYDSLEEWKKHVIEVHVTNVAFYQGEGPGTTQARERSPSRKSSEPWLFDENGRQVTPSVDEKKNFMDQRQLEGGTAKQNNKKRWVRKREDGSLVPRKRSTREDATDNDDVRIKEQLESSIRAKGAAAVSDGGDDAEDQVNEGIVEERPRKRRRGFADVEEEAGMDEF